MHHSGPDSGGQIQEFPFPEKPAMTLSQEWGPGIIHFSKHLCSNYLPAVSSPSTMGSPEDTLLPALRNPETQTGEDRFTVIQSLLSKTPVTSLQASHLQYSFS